MARAFVFAGGGEVTVRGRGPDYEIARDGQADRARAVLLPDGRLSLLFDDGHQVCGRVLRREAAEIEISTPRGRWRVGVTDPLRARLSAVSAKVAATESESEDVRALMPGRVVEVAVAVGDSVAAGALLLVLEAMKMQNELRATHAGIVMRCTALAGQTVEAGTLLLTIQPNREGSPQAFAAGSR
jgi:3-methylcrotonyl-CoA carboxylase alpha subunit